MFSKEKGVNNRTTAIMTAAVLAGFTIILLMNMASFFGIESVKYLSPNMVRGIAIEHKGLLYTLNFDQQNRFIAILNRSIPISEAMVEKRKSAQPADEEIQKIVVYRFNAPDLEIRPKAYVERLNSASPQNAKEPQAMVLAVKELTPTGLLEETTAGELHQLFSETYDP